MRVVLQKNWTAEHHKNCWEWVLYTKDIEWDDYEDAATIYADDRDGPFNLSVWDWVDREYMEYEGFKRLQDAKAMGKLLANVKFVNYPHE